MKKLFVRNCLMLILIMQLLSLITYAETNVEFVNCSILRIGMESSFSDESVILRTIDSDGVITNYKCAERVRINGILYKNATDICNNIEVGAFAKMAVEDDAVTVLNYSSSYICYENVEYKNKKRCFNTLNSRQANLPVYYRYNDELVPAYTDENHYYDIEVYDYAICITNMKSKTDAETIEYIEIGSAVSSDFSKSVNLYCESDVMERSILKGELYNEKNNLISESRGEYGELSFRNLENKDAVYTVKFWLEDIEGNRISSKYEKTYKAEKTEYKSLFILQKGTRATISGETVMIKAVDSNGSSEVYNFSERVRINGRLYRNSEDIYNNIGESAFVKAAVEGGVITVLNSSENMVLYENAEYNEETNTFSANGIEFAELAVYYRYNDEHVPAYTDENH